MGAGVDGSTRPWLFLVPLEGATRPWLVQIPLGGPNQQVGTRFYHMKFIWNMDLKLKNYFKL